MDFTFYMLLNYKKKDKSHFLYDISYNNVSKNRLKFVVGIIVFFFYKIKMF